MGTHAKTPIQFELQGTPHAVRAALLQLREETYANGEALANMGSLEIVLGEVLNNVVEHALAGRVDGLIVVRCLHESSEWRVIVRDNGIHMPNGKLPPGVAPDVDTTRENLPEGGFGWSLVRMLARDLHYERSADWNVLSFTMDG
ncbi:ATP-binding protein [Shimia abyssi]|uniref:Serine/threonine-protein kinase RsbW n=1 Tax=Shimia abyssi TaxID=1662395 RepID=A0A2P8FHW3_9RHOB|nr:ATP-binding protein [Shimia abyssi]PSL21295.1 serine/threonine-protein kinase RsbW [Shimia abyssi]